MSTATNKSTCAAGASPTPRAKPPVFKSEREADILASIRLALGLEPDLVLWRNAVTRLDVWNPSAGGSTMVHGGLPVGSADLVGILSMPIESMERALGVFFALEVKRPGQKARPEQDAWLALVRKRGGFAAVVHSVEEAKSALGRARRGEQS